MLHMYIHKYVSSPSGETNRGVKVITYVCTLRRFEKYAFELPVALIYMDLDSFSISFQFSEPHYMMCKIVPQVLRLRRNTIVVILQHGNIRAPYQ